MDLDRYVIDAHVLQPSERMKLYNDLSRKAWEVSHGDRDNLTIKAFIPKGKTPEDLLALPPGVTFYKF